MKKKKISVLVLCCAMLCTMLTLPAQAATGSVTDTRTGAAVGGAKVTCQLKYNGEWVDWIGVIDPKSGDPSTSSSDTYGADYYGQNNPMYSDANGRYGWMMPAGTYRVMVTADGYETFTSEEYTVGGGEGALEPSAQVNIPLVPVGYSSGGSSSSNGSSSSSGESGSSSDGGSSRPNTSVLVKGSLPSGEVQMGSQLTLKITGSGVTVRYTTDGTDPTLKSAIYNKPIVIDKAMTVKIAAVRNNVLGTVVAYTYTMPNSAATTAKLGTFRADAASIRYLKGYADGTFRPDQAATRYEVVEALSYLVVLDEGEDTLPFTDVDAAHTRTVARMVRSGLINGMTVNTFQGESPMTRCQLCKVLTLALELTPRPGTASFPDIQGHWAVPYINALTEAGYIKGYTDGTFRPDRPVTRAELAILLNRAAGREGITEESFEYQDLPAKFWGYQEVINAALY